jgi:hypothetical protein
MFPCLNVRIPGVSAGNRSVEVAPSSPFMRGPRHIDIFPDMAVQVLESVSVHKTVGLAVSCVSFRPRLLKEANGPFEVFNR